MAYDHYHVLAKCGCEVMDRVHVNQANQLRNGKAPRKVVKG